MAVDPRWLAQVRRKNQERFGMAGMSGMTTTGARDLVDGLNRQRDIRTLQIQEGLHEKPPAPDSLAAAAALLPEIEIPEIQPLPKALVWGGVALVFGLVVYAAWPKK